MSQRSERGQTTAEYVGVLVVVAAIVAAIVLGHPGRLIATGTRAKVCDIARDPCGSIATSTPKHHRGGLGRFLGNTVGAIGSGLSSTADVVGRVGVGVYEGVRDPVVMGYKLSPLRAALDPSGFAKDTRAFGEGLLHGVSHPSEMAKAAVDWDTWADDPARAVGHLIPSIVMTIASAGTGKVALTGESAVSAEVRAAAENEARAAAQAATKSAAENAATNAAEHAAAIAGRRLTAAMFRKLLVTGDGEAVFWSGLGSRGDEVAALYTSKYGGTTLEQLLKAKGVKMPPWTDGPAAEALWRKASLAFAQGARGTVRVVLGDNVRSDGVWMDIERKALEANPRVTRIVAIDPRTGSESVLFVR